MQPCPRRHVYDGQTRSCAAPKSAPRSVSLPRGRVEGCARLSLLGMPISCMSLVLRPTLANRPGGYAPGKVTPSLWSSALVQPVHLAHELGVA